MLIRILLFRNVLSKCQLKHSIFSLVFDAFLWVAFCQNQRNQLYEKTRLQKDTWDALDKKFNTRSNNVSVNTLSSACVSVMLRSIRNTSIAPTMSQNCLTSLILFNSSARLLLCHKTHGAYLTGCKDCCANTNSLTYLLTFINFIKISNLHQQLLLLLLSLKSNVTGQHSSNRTYCGSGLNKTDYQACKPNSTPACSFADGTTHTAGQNCSNAIEKVLISRLVHQSHKMGNELCSL